MRNTGFFLLLYIVGISVVGTWARHHHVLEDRGKKIHHQHHKKHHHGYLLASKEDSITDLDPPTSFRLSISEPSSSNGSQSYGISSLEENKKKTRSSKRKEIKPNSEKINPKNTVKNIERILSRNRRQKDMQHPITTSKKAVNTSLLPECKNNGDCASIANSFCDEVICACDKEYLYVPEESSCHKRIRINETCTYNEQCYKDNSFCDADTKKCICKPSFVMRQYPDFGVNCVDTSGGTGGTKVDPAVIGAVIGLAMMFIIICVVLRMFSKERFRENRSIFNTPNPRLMNASLFKESKLLSPSSRGERRGSRASVRGPSRASSIASVNKEGISKSPNGSLAKGRRGSALSTVSATGSASGCATSSATPKASSPNAKNSQETSVAIEAVD